MIRNVVIHVSNEQPLLADLYTVPAAGDQGLLCTNVRMLDGKRPIFIDQIASTFFFPYLHLRFLEIPPGEMARHAAEGGTGSDAFDQAATAGPDGPTTMPVLAMGAGPGADEPPELDVDVDLGDIDEGFLQRIRDI